MRRRTRCCSSITTPDIAGGLLPLDVGALRSTFAYATGTGTFGSFLFPTGLAAGQRLFWRLNYLFLLAWNFASAALGLAAWGLWRFWRMKERRGCFLFFGLGIAAQIAWSANYLIWDMYAFSLPVYVMLGVPLIVGVDALLASARKTAERPGARHPRVPGICSTRASAGCRACTR